MRESVREARDSGLTVVWLMTFETKRRHRRCKDRVPDPRRPYPALENYLFVRIDVPADFDKAAAAGLSRVPWGAGYAPRLSRRGVMFVTRPPRQLFPDTDIPRLSKLTPDALAHEYKPGDAVTLYGCGFDGYSGVIKRLKGASRVMIELDETLFEVEADAASIARAAA